MRAVSLFSGAGGFEVGFDMAGIETVLQAESDPWALAVLERHWPDVERVTDVRDVGKDAPRDLDGGRGDMGGGVCRSDPGTIRQHGPGASDRIDLVYGGWPCQGNSVAGKRAGLSDERSGLWTEVRRVLRELRPRWFVGENVPGLLSVCSCVACELTRGWAAEHLAERARAGGAGPCRCTECGEGARLRATHSGRDFGHVLADLDDLGYGVAWRIVDARWFGVPQRRRRVFVVGCLGDAARAAAVLAVCQSCGGHPTKGRPAGEGPAAATESGARVAGCQYQTSNVTAAVTSKWAKGTGGPSGDEAQNLVAAREPLPVVASAISASAGHHGHSSPRGDGSDNLIGFHATGGAHGVDAISDTSATLKVGSGLGIQSTAAVASSSMGVRRLTPLECSRLQGFPDDWVAFRADGTPIPDSHQYRLLGNAVATVCAQWLGHRLVAVDAMMREQEGA